MLEYFFGLPVEEGWRQWSEIALFERRRSALRSTLQYLE